MSPSPTRRGLLRGLIAALFGWDATRATAAATPGRCPHYYDGLLWASGGAGETGYYRRDREGCPYCRPGQGGGTPVDEQRQVLAGPLSSFCYNDGKQVSTIDPGGRVTTFVHDASGRCLGPQAPPPPS